MNLLFTWFQTPVLALPVSSDSDSFHSFHSDSGCHWGFSKQPADSSDNFLVFERSSKHISCRLNSQGVFRFSPFSGLFQLTNKNDTKQSNNPGISRFMPRCQGLFIFKAQEILPSPFAGSHPGVSSGLLHSSSVFPHDEVRGTRCQMIGRAATCQPQWLVVSGRSQMKYQQ